MRKALLITLCILFAFITSANAGEIYMYKNKDGNTVISNEPVPEKHKNKAVKIESSPLTSSEIRAKLIATFGLDPEGYQDIYEYVDDLSPKNYKKFVDGNRSNSEKLGLSYTIDGMGKITKVISKNKVERNRQKAREQEMMQQAIIQNELEMRKQRQAENRQQEMERKMQEMEDRRKQMEIEAEWRQQKMERKQKEMEEKQEELERKQRQMKYDSQSYVW